jgi:hypothetical protein
MYQLQNYVTSNDRMIAYGEVETMGREKARGSFLKGRVYWS